MDSFFFFNDTATTEIYTLSLHDALPISGSGFRRSLIPMRDKPRQIVFIPALELPQGRMGEVADEVGFDPRQDRKSTRLNSSHANISYAVFCLKKKTKTITPPVPTYV